MRKRLGDLLREEAGKPLPPESTPSPTPPPTATTTRRTRKPVAAEAIAPPESPSTKPTDQTHDPDPLQALSQKLAHSLERQVALEAELVSSRQHQEELSQQLANTRQREQSLSQQLTEWQTKLEQQQTLTHKLQADLQQNQQLKQELAAAKTVILELSAIKAGTESTPVAKLSDLKSSEVKPAAIELAPPAQPQVYKFERIGWTPLAPHLIQSHLPPSKLSDADLGWVD
jgi:hypothetical protein